MSGKIALTRNNTRLRPWLMNFAEKTGYGAPGTYVARGVAVTDPVAQSFGPANPQPPMQAFHAFQAQPAHPAHSAHPAHPAQPPLPPQPPPPMDRKSFEQLSKQVQMMALGQYDEVERLQEFILQQNKVIQELQRVQYTTDRQMSAKEQVVLQKVSMMQEKMQEQERTAAQQISSMQEKLQEQERTATQLLEEMSRILSTERTTMAAKEEKMKKGAIGLCVICYENEADHSVAHDTRTDASSSCLCICGNCKPIMLTTLAKASKDKSRVKCPVPGCEHDLWTSKRAVSFVKVVTSHDDPTAADQLVCIERGAA